MPNINRSIDLVQHAVTLVVVSMVGLAANWTGTGVDIFSALPGMAIIYAIVMVGLVIAKIAPFYLPSIAWISIIAIGLTLPVSPAAGVLLPHLEKVSFLSLSVPILAYAGLAVAGRELEAFKKSGWKIVVVGVFVFLGTFLGSAVVAEVVLRMQGKIR